jgi:hypothetical protein
VDESRKARSTEEGDGVRLEKALALSEEKFCSRGRSAWLGVTA